jgi:radical SAM protein with 4Fe4S-binding SPASM domain
MSKYGIDCDWQCNHLSMLRLDADGALMICNDIRGDVAEKYNIRTLTADSYETFKADWERERSSLNCSGCYWSCFCFAEENQRLGRNEFYYLEEKVCTLM